jgi:predicted dienelactone hydrolase
VVKFKSFLSSALAGLAAVLFACAAQAGAVGFQSLTVPQPGGGTMEVAVWYPTDAAPKDSPVATFIQTVAVDAAPSPGVRPLVVISHGNGGSLTSHADTAFELAKAGFVAASLSHPGDTYKDQSGAVDIANRPVQLKALVDYMVRDWSGHDRIDPARIGAFGFSAGGFTVLTLVGGEADLMRFGPHCRQHPDYYDCRLIAKSTHRPSVKAAWAHDARIKAAVVAAPALGFAFTEESLAGIKAPIQLWRADEDQILPPADYADVVHAALPGAEFHGVANAVHLDFLAPCSDILRKAEPFICTSRPGFDRIAFHKDLNARIVRFFKDRL